MKVLKTNIYLILVSIFLSSCSEIYVDHVSMDKDISIHYDFNSNFANVWKAVIHALSKDEVIKYLTNTMDDTVGIIVTEYNIADDMEIPYSPEKKSYKYSYTINLYTQDVEKTTVKIVVNLLTSQFEFQQGRLGFHKLEEKLRNKLITRVCNNLFPNNKGECYTLSSTEVATGSPLPAHEHQQKTGDSQTIQVQKALQDAGYEPGDADGILGEQTRRALQQYQEDNKLPVTNQIDQNTLISLGIIRKKPERIAPKPENTLETISEEKAALSKKEQTPPPITIQPIEIETVESNLYISDEEKQETSPKVVPQQPISKGVTVQDCILWSEADTTGNILAEIPMGTPLDILGTVSFFYKVKYQEKEGFVYIYFVETNNEN